MLSVYQLPDRFFMCASVQTEDGFYIASAPTSSVALDASDSDLGRLISEALQTISDIGIVPTPQRNQYQNLTRKVLHNSGYSSWFAVHQKGKLCELLNDGALLTIVPTRNGGTKGDHKGFLPLREKALTVGDVDFETRGRQLREGFRLCE